MPQIFTLVPVEGGAPLWLENEDLEALQIEAYKLIESHGGGYARFIINGKSCKVSAPVQVFFIENPEAGGPPLPFNPPASPTFDDDGKTMFLAPRPSV